MRYAKVDTTIEFPTGSTLAYVTIPILTDSAWHTCEEFAVKLADPDRCHIRGGGCRVKIIDEDCFPSNDVAEYLVPPSSLDEVPQRTFAWSFIRLCMMQPDIKRKALIHVSISLLHNLYFLMTVFLKVYLINVLLAKAGDEAHAAAARTSLSEQATDDQAEVQQTLRRLEHRDIGSGGLLGSSLLVPDNLEATAAILAALYMVPFALLHILDVVRARLGISGTIRRTLISALFRRFMSYKAYERAKIPDADISMACVRDIPVLVSDGFMRLFHVIEVALRIFVTMIFLLVENRYAILPFAIYPILAALWMVWRRPQMQLLQEKRLQSDNAVVRGVHQACTNQDLIQDFKKRSKAVDRFWDYVVANSSSRSACSVFDLNNSRFFPWLTMISMVLYIFWGVQQLQQGESSVGTFMATFGIFHEVGHTMETGYDSVITMFQAFHLVKNLTKLLNVPTDDEDRMLATRLRLQRGIQEREELQRKMTVGTSQYVDDLIDMKIINVKYATQQMPKSLSSSENILDGVSFRMPQGKVIVLQGGERQGKSTLLRLIAGELPPTSGEIFIPPHLTVLQVHEAPSFIPGSLKRNLLFGISGGDDEQMLGDITRVVGICERLRMAQSLISRLHQDWMSGADEDDDEWLSALTSTDKMTIHLARAFIANPHVLVMHKPLMRFYQEELRKATMVTIEEFVKYRGLGLNNAPDEITKRRTRTVVLSQFHSLELDHAEMVFQLENGQVLQNQAPARGTTG